MSEIIVDISMTICHCLYMQKIPNETDEQYYRRMEEAAKTLTQIQIDACAWVMGGSGCGWTKEAVLAALPVRSFYPSEAIYL